MKKSFSLLITIVLISIFSYLSIFLIEKKSLSMSNTTTLYLHTQAKLHMDFFKKYIKSIDLKSKCYKEITFKDEIYNFSANISYENDCKNSSSNKASINLSINASSKLESVRLHEKVILEL